MRESGVNTAVEVEELVLSYQRVRSLTDELTAPLSPEDQTVQSMPDVSPTKWHRGHTSWFFETFLLQPFLSGYDAFHPLYGYLFNSYYEAVGPRHPRPGRGLVSRPGAEEVGVYRRHVDLAMIDLLASSTPSEVPASEIPGPVSAGRDLFVLGLHHEQQHQELLLMDIKNVLSVSPLRPAYRSLVEPQPSAVPPLKWIGHEGGIVEVGHSGSSFAFDNESPRHTSYLAPFELAARPVTVGEWLSFIDAGGYERAELWLSDGWQAVQTERWEAPLYWQRSGNGGDWAIFTLSGLRCLDPGEPVCHVSYYEADAYARWFGARLPSEMEWEAVATGARQEGRFLDPDTLHPRPATTADGVGDGVLGDFCQLYGDVWEWTGSAYLPYPGFRPAAGAVGEYNGKFMVNQHVLRGGSCLTPAGHLRPTYRNFFPPAARWAMSGVRLARSSA
ncbi:MAG: ergothioneine biosynthesis protein EgtB [Acidimicrobiia bacterium]